MVKACRVKQRTNGSKRKKLFYGTKKLVVYSVDMDVNNSNIGIESNCVDTNLNINKSVEDINVNMMRTVDFNILGSDQISASAKKIKNISSSRPLMSSRLTTGYRFIDLEILNSVVSTLRCPECMSLELILSEKENKRKGLASCLYIDCFICNYSKEFYSSTFNKQKSYDINTRAVYAMRSCGQGYSGFSRFVSLMDMPKPMTINNYNKIVSKLTNAVKCVAEDTMMDAAQELKDLKNDHSVLNSINDRLLNVIDVAVSCDGTWQRRGYSSNNGVVSIISMETGKVLDVEAMNKVCKGCFLKEHLKKENPFDYEKWHDKHKCTYNYQGLSGGMEPEGAHRIWNRSIEKHNLRYTEFYGDGDSKGYDAVKNIYEGVLVNKLECVGHVQKRVGTRLRNLKKKEKGLGGRGKLTDATIDRLQNYYGIAIRQNKNNLNGMKSAIRATLYHVASSKNENLHFPHCPEGADSWCRYNRDKANHTSTYRPGPGLPISIVWKLKPIYEDLSNDILLKKCLHGLTQNNNESFNMTIWERIPKNHYVSLTHLQFGTFDAVAHFNIGKQASVLILEKMDLRPGMYMLEGCRQINKKRLYLSRYKNLDHVKKRRQVIRGKKKNKYDKSLEKEGNPYQTGAF